MLPPAMLAGPALEATGRAADPAARLRRLGLPPRGWPAADRRPEGTPGSCQAAAAGTGPSGEQSSMARSRRSKRTAGKRRRGTEVAKREAKPGRARQRRQRAGEESEPSTS